MTDLEPLIEKHFRALEASAVGSGFGRYLRPVMLGSAHLVLAAGIREAYELGRTDAALAVREWERLKRDESRYTTATVPSFWFR